MLTGHGEQKYTTGRRLASSLDRNWPTLLSERWQHRAGDLPVIKPAETEIAMMLSGRQRVKRRGDGRVQDTLAVPGTIWLCPAGIQEDEIHIYGDIEDCIHIYIPAAPLINAALNDLDVDPDRVKLRYEGGFHDPLIEQIGLAIAAEMEEESAAGTLLVESMRVTLAAHITRHYSTLPSNKRLAQVNGALAPKKLQRVIDYIEANLNKNISLEDLASQACLSEYHFARAFKATLGVSPHCYVTNKKLDSAKQLMSDKSKTLIEISMMTGFSTQAHFTKVFKRAVGVTPGEYRTRLTS